jgi:hypothetical protein
MNKLYPSLWRRPPFFRKSTIDGSQFIETVNTPVSLQFSTQLNGGFAQASFSIGGDKKKTYDRYRDYFGAHAVFYDSWGRSVYEGLVQDVGMDSKGVHVDLDGYFSIGNDLLDGLIYAAYGFTVKEIIMDCIELTDGYWFDSSKYLVNASSTFIEDKDYRDVKINDVIMEALQLGLSLGDPTPIYFAIWNDRMPHLFADPLSHTRWGYTNVWLIRNSNLTGQLEAARSRTELFNRVYGMIDGESGMVLTDPYNDVRSQARYGIREGIISVGGLTLGLANSMAEEAVKRNANPPHTIPVELSGMIENFYGYKDYIYKIRAGDVAIFVDVDPLSSVFKDNEQIVGMKGSLASGLRSVVMRSEYDQDSGVMNLDLNTKDRRLDTLLAQLGLGGNLG